MNWKLLPVQKNKIWLSTAVNHFCVGEASRREGILAWVLGNLIVPKHFNLCGRKVCCWQCYFYVTDGWKVYVSFIPPADHMISKIYITRVEGENTRLRHYLARLDRKTLCYSKSLDMLKYSIRLLLHYLKYREIPVFT
ncbi:IS1 family transposase [Nostoc sp.]|uniref:IS1 family transposase n=1 Tax=Nostoc sp. TaxID=1180 RepID=UPI003FA5AC50